MKLRNIGITLIKLAKEGTYNGTLFHRVIKDSWCRQEIRNLRMLRKVRMLGTGDVGYTILPKLSIRNTS